MHAHRFGKTTLGFGLWFHGSNHLGTLLQGNTPIVGYVLVKVVSMAHFTRAPYLLQDYFIICHVKVIIHAWFNCLFLSDVWSLIHIVISALREPHVPKEKLLQDG